MKRDGNGALRKFNQMSSIGRLGLKCLTDCVIHLCSLHHVKTYLTRVMRKQALRSLSSYQKRDGRAWPHDSDFLEFKSFDFIDHVFLKSVSYQKKDGLGHAHPSFFWYDNDKDLKVCFLVTHIISTLM